MMRLYASSTPPSIEPWRSATEIAIAGKGRSLGSPASLSLLAMGALLVGMTPFFEFDRIVTSTGGKIVATQAVKRVQALDPSIIRTVDVREGQEVYAGQQLVTLDPTFAAADVDQLRQQIAGLDAQILRAEAEQSHSALSFPEPSSAQDALYMALQRDLFAQRAAELRAQILSFDEKIKTTEATITKIMADQALTDQRAHIAQQVEGMRDTLYKSGATSLLNLLQASDLHLEMQRTLENDQNSLVELRHQLAALRSDREGSIQNWYATSSQELLGARNQRDTAIAALEKATKHQDLVVFKAQEPSVVLTLSQLSPGSVLKAGDLLLSLAPLDEAVEAEIHFSAADIGFVRPGNQVTVKIDAFDYFEHGTAQGRLQWISEGTFTADDDNKPVNPYYKARVVIEKYNFINVPSNFRLIPGMTLSADINAGRRSAFKYVVGGLFRGLEEGLREP